MTSNHLTVRNLLGSGWNFPITPDASNRQILYINGPDKVRQSIWIILETEPGERIMRSDFGCGLRRYLMKPNTAATRALMQRDIERSLSLWEPRIRVEEITVEPGDEPSMVLIHVHYAHVRDGSPGNLVYPFYLQ